MPTTSLAISDQRARNTPASFNVVATDSVQVRGTKQIIPAGTPTLLQLPKGPKGVIAHRDYLAFNKAGVMATQAAAPSITSFAPGSAANTGLVTVTITGTGFEVGAGAYLRSTVDPDDTFALGSVTRVSATSITFNVPATVPEGTYKVVVTDADVDVVSVDTLTVT